MGAAIISDESTGVGERFSSRCIAVEVSGRTVHVSFRSGVPAREAIGVHVVMPTTPRRMTVGRSFGTVEQAAASYACPKVRAAIGAAAAHVAA